MLSDWDETLDQHAKFKIVVGSFRACQVLNLQRTLAKARSCLNRLSVVDVDLQAFFQFWRFRWRRARAMGSA